jgi:3-isopropylmalate/(R)-2-methylmalate dehydratase large subunit
MLKGATEGASARSDLRHGGSLRLDPWPRPSAINEPSRRAMVEDLEAHTRQMGVTLFGLGDQRQGIVHVVGPEQGLSQPGMIIVCGDSHTATHGALGALAFGIGASEVAHVLATQALWQRKAKNMRVTVDGVLGTGRACQGCDPGHHRQDRCRRRHGHVIEYAGSTIRALSIEGRLTLCNMSIEAGARAGMVAPDDATYHYLHGRPYAPKGADWDKAWPVAHVAVRSRGPLRSRGSARCGERSTHGDLGTSPAAAAPITGVVPEPAAAADASDSRCHAAGTRLHGAHARQPLSQIAINRVFIGSCTNSRIEDLRAAAKVAAGRRSVVPAMVVPGSGLVKAQAEAEGLDVIFRRAGSSGASRDAPCASA